MDCLCWEEVWDSLVRENTCTMLYVYICISFGLLAVVRIYMYM